MKIYQTVIFALIISLPNKSALAQSAPAGTTITRGYCSPAVSGVRDTITINCYVGRSSSGDVIRILNKILANQLDTDAVMKKLDEVLAAQSKPVLKDSNCTPGGITIEGNISLSQNYPGGLVSAPANSKNLCIRQNTTAGPGPVVVLHDPPPQTH
jgi:hypothetical protein